MQETLVSAIVVCAVVALLALMGDAIMAVSFINFGAFLSFSLVDLSVIVHFAHRISCGWSLCTQPKGWARFGVWLQEPATRFEVDTQSTPGLRLACGSQAASGL